MKQLMCVVCVLLTTFASAQKKTNEEVSQKDLLKATLGPERAYDVKHYKLDITVEPDSKYISGYNEIEFIVEEELNKIQIDLFKNLSVDSVVYNRHHLLYERLEDAVFISFRSPLEKKETHRLRFYYSGNPIEAVDPPWDGGFVFKKDKQGNHFIATASQGVASSWWPHKDHSSDEPDGGMEISVAVPNGLKVVSNGHNAGKVDLHNGYTRWDWGVQYPINNYAVAIYIGDFEQLGNDFRDLDYNFFVLKENVSRARKQFLQVKPMMNCFQEKFGEYPFKIDGYKIVESPYLGMENQSAIAYGNGFQNGYKGKDLSKTGIGLKFDFIIIHESAHEWFGNSITGSDLSDLWIHESFATYAEAVFVECQWDYNESIKYLNGIKRLVHNDKPILPKRGINRMGSRDMYFKGALMLNTIRHILDNEYLWNDLLKDYTSKFRHKIISTDDVISFFEDRTRYKVRSIFNQYLKYANIPTVELKEEKGGEIYAKWDTDVSRFTMPLIYKLHEKGNARKIDNLNNRSWKKIPNATRDNILIDTDKIYVNVHKNWSE